MSSREIRDNVDILVLGAGWTSQFLVPLLRKQSLTFALTTTRGTVRDTCAGIYDESHVIPFAFEPDSNDESQFHRLPTAQTIIITFPLSGKGPAKKLVETYNRIHAGHILPNWIQLGSTGIYKEAKYHDHTSDITPNARSEAEEELMSLNGAVLNLAGLWGDTRLPWNWVSRVANTKEKLRDKTSLHLIHGIDVARACLAMHHNFTQGERWIVTDRHVYDWWDLIDGWADELEEKAGGEQPKPEYKRWIAEIMKEEGVGILPRDKDKLGRVLNSSKFWEVMGILPERILTRKIETSV